MAFPSPSRSQWTTAAKSSRSLPGPKEWSPLRRLLRSFLHHCDLVKFARVSPEPREMDESVARCRQFILPTEPENELNNEPDKESLHAV